MKRFLTTLIFVLAFGAALALELPQEAKLTVVSGTTIVGVGELDEDGLELDLLAGFSGDVVVTATDEEGNIVVYDATIVVTDSGVAVVVRDWDTLTTVDLAEAVAASERELSISFVDTVEAEDESEDAEDAEDESEDAEEDESEDNEDAEDESEDAEDESEDAEDESEDAEDAEDESEDAEDTDTDESTDSSDEPAETDSGDETDEDNSDSSTDEESTQDDDTDDTDTDDGDEDESDEGNDD